ncbi:hypothetical protein K437DRAFT_275183 [Tilletiaria anomala UBC 951]|uniref:Uncharacterized protein n=1 Tax=Tilletiaria anomala (strain ATCC 24038 / CBS 436.72 / UBC 951) TaxID=1037660 RepID=A0A066VQ83_TILAU|nr:uncharacterized protein K437DRAFT_275183 [Tilletiaria anomala UBC 951]KDN42418.1 hypothetical protein K437DRAFT_275183 [Tilletiaria anomala UBC 951]
MGNKQARLQTAPPFTEPVPPQRIGILKEYTRHASPVTVIIKQNQTGRLPLVEVRDVHTNELYFKVTRFKTQKTLGFPTGCSTLRMSNAEGEALFYLKKVHVLQYEVHRVRYYVVPAEGSSIIKDDERSPASNTCASSLPWESHNITLMELLADCNRFDLDYYGTAVLRNSAVADAGPGVGEPEKLEFTYAVDREEGEIRNGVTKQPLARLAKSHKDVYGRSIYRKGHHCLTIQPGICLATMVALHLLTDEYRRRLIKYRETRGVVTNPYITDVGHFYTKQWHPLDSPSQQGSSIEYNITPRGEVLLNSHHRSGNHADPVLFDDHGVDIQGAENRNDGADDATARISVLEAVDVATTDTGSSTLQLSPRTQSP